MDRTAGQMLNLEDLVHSIQFASMQKEVFEALAAGNKTLEQLNAQTKMEDVENLMDDTREAVEYQQQISKLLGSELNEQDEKDIEDIIAEWESEEVEKLPVATAAQTAESSSASPVEASSSTEKPAVAARPKPVKAGAKKEVVLA